MTKTITRDELIDLMNKKFPLIWTKESELFDGRENGIWTGEGSMIDEDYLAFDHYSESPLYEMGVHKDLVVFLDEYGQYAEAHDGGTYFIYIQ